METKQGMHTLAGTGPGQACPAPRSQHTDCVTSRRSADRKDRGWLQTSPSLTALWPKNSQ